MISVPLDATVDLDVRGAVTNTDAVRNVVV